MHKFLKMILFTVIMVVPSAAFAGCSPWVVDSTDTTCVSAGYCLNSGKQKTVTRTFESRKCTASWKRETRKKQRSVCGC